MKTARRWNAGRVLRDYQSMTDNDPTEVEGTDLEPRDVRALTEYMTVLEDLGDARGADGLYVVVSQSGGEYLVDHAGGACECPDDTYGDDDHACKHRRRVAFATGAEAIPGWADLDAVDERLGEHVTADGPRVAVTDGGHVAADLAADTDASAEGRPDDCGCTGSRLETEGGLPCWPCYRADFDAPNPAARDE